MRTTSPQENIPNLDNLYQVTKEYVKEHQGKKGFIETSDSSCDGIFAIYYDWVLENATEKFIVGVRVNEADEFQIIAEGDDEWENVYGSDTVYYVPTLFNIASYIEEYVPEEPKVRKYKFRFHAHTWEDIEVAADNKDDAFEIAKDIYDSGEYEPCADGKNYENTDCEDITDY